MNGEPVRMGRLDGADVWRLDLDVGEPLVAAAWEMLSFAERARASSMAREEARARFVVSRAGLRRTLAGYAGGQPAALPIAIGPHGKPMLPGGPRFSLSHSDAVAVFAVSADREVGIDVEHVRPVPEADSILGRWFAEAERRAWITSDRGDGAFVRLWTRREAYLKALGVGFSEDGAPREMDPSRWEIHDLEPAPGYLGALVVERSGAEESRRARP